MVNAYPAIFTAISQFCGTYSPVEYLKKKLPYKAYASLLLSTMIGLENKTI